MNDISLAVILSDPITYGIALAIFALLYVLKRYGLPYIKARTADLSERYGKTAQLLLTALRAAEQARIKGDLNGFAAMFGMEVDLSDNDAVRDAVVAWVQKQLVDNFKWGYKVKVSDIMVILHDLMRQDAHKGQVDPLEEIAQGGVGRLLQYISPDMIMEAADMLSKQGTPQLAVTSAMPAVSPRRRSR